MHPTGCPVMCILRGVVFCASFEVPCYVHPSRCLVMCILRGAVFCASFEMPCYVHPSRYCVLCIHRAALLCASFEATLVRVLFFWKNVFPLLTSRCPEAVYVEKGVLFCGTLIDYLLTTEATRGNFIFLEKRLPLSCALLSSGSFCFMWIE